MQAGGGVVVVVARRECNAKWCECVVWETESMCEDVNIIENVVKETNATENIELIGKTNKSWDWQICYIMLNQRPWVWVAWLERLFNQGWFTSFSKLLRVDKKNATGFEKSDEKN